MGQWIDISDDLYQMHEQAIRDLNVTDGQRVLIDGYASRTPHYSVDTDRDFCERVFNDINVDTDGSEGITLLSVIKVLASR